MQCKACGAENPIHHRFCGMCGTALERRSKLQPNGYFSDRQGAEPVLKQEFSAPDAAVGVLEQTAAPMASAHGAATPETWERPVVAERPVVTPVQAVPIIERVPATKVVIPVVPPAVEPPRQRPGQEPVFTGATSVLGLSGGMAPLQMSDGAGSDGSYLLATEPRRTVSWRLWALLLILGGVGFLGWRQWYANHYHQRSDLAKILEMSGKALTPGTPPDEEQLATDPSKTGTAEDAAKAIDAQQQEVNPGANGAPATSAGQAANGAAQQASSAQNQSAQSPSTNPATQQPGQNAGEAGKAQTPPSQPAAQPPAQPQTGQQRGPETAQAKPNEASTASARSAAAAEKQPPKKVADAAPGPNYLRDPALLRAQQYIHGHPQNCEMGLNYLKSAAESNPAARIQMAALYQSGVCVPVDRAQAYHWFSMAQQLDPHNMWLEKSRSQLWANMTDAERARAQ